jgi:hypothetical protein
LSWLSSPRRPAVRRLRRPVSAHVCHSGARRPSRPRRPSLRPLWSYVARGPVLLTAATPPVPMIRTVKRAHRLTRASGDTTMHAACGQITGSRQQRRGWDPHSCAGKTLWRRLASDLVGRK